MATAEAKSTTKTKKTARQVSTKTAETNISDVKQADTTSANKDVDENVLVDLEKVSKIYGKSTWAIKKVTMQVKKGEVLAFVGPNGSGKSTLGRLIANVIKQTSGIIDYYFTEENIFRAIGYQAKEQAWPNGFRVKDVTSLWQNIYNVQDEEWIAKLKDIFNINGLENKYLAKLPQVKLELFAIFLACLYKPELLVIDDLSSSVDFETKHKIIDFLKDYAEQGNAVILVYPDEYFLDGVVNRVMYINDGRIVEDLSMNEIRKDFPTVQAFVQSIVSSESENKNNLKADPFFDPIIKRLDNAMEFLNEDYVEYFENKIPEEYSDFDADVKNTLFYLQELKQTIITLSTSALSESSVQTVRDSIIKNKKNLDYMLKKIDKLKKGTNAIKHLSKLEKDIYNTRKLLSTKFADVFKNNKLIMNGDETEVSLEKDDKKALKALKERYIREELKIIRLEARKSRKAEGSIGKRFLKMLTPKEKQVIDKVVAAVNTRDEGTDLVAVLSGEKIVLKKSEDVKKSDFVLYDTRKRQSSFIDNRLTPVAKGGLTDADIYYDKTSDMGYVKKLEDQKKGFFRRLFSRKKKGDK